MRLRTLLAATALTAAALAVGSGTALAADHPLDPACAVAGEVLSHPISPVSLSTTTDLPVQCLLAP